MQERVYLGILYDYYGELLSAKQQEYFEKYYFANLSLQEIASIFQVSRNAVFKQVKKAEQELLAFENSLHLYTKDQKLEKIIKEVSDPLLKEKLEKLLK